jgi:putative transcriptional regulator
VIEVRVDALLGSRGRSFYWLAKETGISHTTLWRLKKGKALGINFITLYKICRALDCQPGDVLRLTEEGKAAGKRAALGKRESSQALRPRVHE